MSVMFGSLSRCVRGMFIVAMIVATVGALVTIVLYGSVLSNGMDAGNLQGFLKVRKHLQEKLVNFFYASV